MTSVARIHRSLSVRQRDIEGDSEAKQKCVHLDSELSWPPQPTRRAMRVDAPLKADDGAVHPARLRKTATERRTGRQSSHREMQRPVKRDGHRATHPLS
jgi:hypothetical protein